MLSASCLLRCSGDWEHAQSQSPSVAGVKRQLLGASEPWKSPELKGSGNPFLDWPLEGESRIC